MTMGIWGLREEARKSWDHVVCDNLVYLPQSGNGNLKRRTQVIAEKYLNLDCWLDVHWTQPDITEGDAHYNAIIERAAIPFKIDFQREGNNYVIPVGRDRAVLVEKPEFVQLPEGSSL